ncbi:MAG TPA: hypothetical protein VJ302_11510 [Blastocatellia bacterium]|nr:hypothetical protein [Blastocatellia bacterium]
MPFRKRLAYLLRHYTPTWRYLFNLRSTLAYRLDQRPLHGTARRILGELSRHGIALTSADELLGADSCFDELNQQVEELRREWAEQIVEARTGADQGEIGRKTFMLQFLGERPRLDPLSAFARFALQSPILDIANAYFGMFTRLRYYNVWHTVVTQSPPRESQLWHYDREDLSILKIFVYLTDVDEGAGPLVYARGTHRRSSLQGAPPSFEEQGVRRWDDEAMGTVIPPDRWTRAIGPKGTIVFADTRGYHKGGLARQQDRTLYTCMFTSPTSQAPELFERPKHMILPRNRAQALALAATAKFAIFNKMQ